MIFSRTWRIWTTFAALLLAGWTTAGRAGEPEAITFLPHWSPQAQFAGYYMARDRGFYAREGLAVTILRGGPDQPAVPALVSGEADIASTFLATALARRAEGVPLKNLAQLGRRSALLLVAKKGAGIRSPADLDGKTVTVWPDFDLQPRALFRKFGVKPRVLPQRQSLDLFLRDGAAAASAMWYNEYHRLLNAGWNEDELVVIRYDDFGLNLPEDGLYCLEKTLRERPTACRAFVRATLAGWRAAFEQPEQALDLVLDEVRAANLPASRSHQRWMLARMKDIMLPDRDPARLGVLDEATYTNAVGVMREAGVTAAAPAYTNFYEDCTR
jgi:NitT/TauT family transport system substrate-binding protein